MVVMSQEPQKTLFFNRIKSEEELAAESHTLSPKYKLLLV